MLTEHEIAEKLKAGFSLDGDIFSADKQVEELLRKIFYKVAISEYGLTERDFALSYVSDSGSNRNHPHYGYTPKYYAIVTGAIQRVYWTYPLPSPVTMDSFKLHMHNCLKQLKENRQTKAIQSKELFVAHREIAKSLLPDAAKARILPSSELIVETFVEVRITHKGTGISVSCKGVEGKGSWQKVASKAKMQLAEVVEIVEGPRVTYDTNGEVIPKPFVDLSEYTTPNLERPRLEDKSNNPLIVQAWKDFNRTVGEARSGYNRLIVDKSGKEIDGARESLEAKEAWRHYRTTLHAAHKTLDETLKEIETLTLVEKGN